MNTAPRGRLRWVLAAGFVVALVLVGVLGRGCGSAPWPVRNTQNAYLAFGQIEWTRSADAPLDQIARANLELAAEGLAEQLRSERSVHPPGTLVTLSYEALGENGATLDRWTVRAIVPMLGDGGALDAEVWTARLPDIESRLRKHGGRMLRSSGATGLPAEALLRLPVGAAIEIATPAQFATTDLLDATSRALRPRSFSWATGPVTTPARLRVTLIDACAADVRVGRTTELEFAPFAPVPIPTGFKERRWVQMTGCDPRPLEIGTTMPPALASAPYAERDDLPLLHVGRDGSVYVDERSETQTRTARYRIETICRFDTELDRWQVLHRSAPSDAGVELPPPGRQSSSRDGIVARLPPVGLYWLRWSGRVVASDADNSARSYHTFGYVGGMLCNDVDLGPAPDGQVATCVPFLDRAEARFVPDPASACAAPPPAYH